MARGSKPGERRGGRAKGTPNKRTQELQALMDRMDCNPHEFMAQVTKGEVPCKQCNGGQVTAAQWTKMLGLNVPTRYMDESGDVDIEGLNTDTLPCPYCGGTELQPVDMVHRVAAAKELAQYLAPKRKAVDMQVDTRDVPVLVVRGMRGKT